MTDTTAPTDAGVLAGPTATGEQPKSKHEVGWRRIVRNFTPSWFAVNMGTGVVSVLLHNLPHTAAWVRHAAQAVFCANAGLFAGFAAVSALRYALYPGLWRAMVSHPAQSLFLGCVPMGFATIINMMVLSCAGWGAWVVDVAWAFWWADALVSVATCVSLPFVVMHRHRPGLRATTAALLLPVVPAVVASATGGLVADALLAAGHPRRAALTVVASYVLWGLGQALAACILALYFHRLTVHSLPPRDAIVSVFLPVGPLGQGGFAVQQLGRVALALASLPDAPPRLGPPPGVDAVRAAEVLYVLGLFLGLVLWGFALVWLCFALISLATTRRFPFNMGWWGLTFPLGVWATCTGMLAVNLDSAFFKIATTAISLAVVLLWLMVASRTLHLALTGDIFFAPCLKALPNEEQANEYHKDV